MSELNHFINEEVDFICSTISFYEQFRNKSFFVTGATGLIGSFVMRVLSKLNNEHNLNIKIYGAARSKTKVSEMNFDDNIKWLYCSLTDQIILDDEIDYIIHTASPTDSSFFVEKPVEVINETINGMNNILQFAISKKVKGFVFTSSLEVYGICNEDRFLKENEYFSIDCNNVRNSYSEGKKLLECLCSSYASEYNVPTRIIRLGQTFGPGVRAGDNRVFSQFANYVSSGQDIVLATKGETKRSYCSLVDALNGIFTALFFGNNGEAYNVASDNSYCSIYEMAQMFVKNSNSKVVIKKENNNKYLGTLKFGLDTTKIKSLGFKSYESLDIVIPKFIRYWKEQK